MSDDAPKLRLGTRSSKLARWQADWVSARLQEDGYEIEQVFVKTTGDVTTGPLDQMGGVGVFTRELQKALLDSRVDLVVHSLKDMPTQSPEGLSLAAVPLRASAQDVLVSKNGEALDALPAGSRVGTGSNRRRAQLLFYRQDLEIVGIRGNVDTRLRKLDDGEYDAIVLAEAGLERLGWGNLISQRLPIDVCLPAPGQGALGIEVRADDAIAGQAVCSIDDPKHRAATTAERVFLAKIEAGCSSPAAAWARHESENRLVLDVAVLDVDGKQKVSHSFDSHPSQASAMGSRAAQWALDNGASALL